jgi:hypothetical protein
MDCKDCTKITGTTSLQELRHYRTTVVTKLIDLYLGEAKIESLAVFFRPFKKIEG